VNSNKGEGGVKEKEVKGRVNFLPLKREGLLERGAYLKGRLNRGFRVIV